ncbi:MAG: hypothetical protein QOH06_5687 [Acidobacteriota bacterium]|jgi:hypothetical protein|nr:hypothetical protein [Acidobacteriota bacterium]
MNGARIKTSLIAALLALGLTQAGAAFAAERITGTVVDPGATTGRSTTVPFSIYIYDYSTDQEVERLAGILSQKGSEALRQELWDLEKGWIRIGNSLGYPVAVARSQPSENGGRHIVLFADRPIQFFEVWNSLRSQDYPFSYFEMNLGKDGTGTGQMYGAAKIRMATGVLSVESFGATPAKLLGVRVR